VEVDLRGSGLTDKPAGPYSTEQMADDVAGLMVTTGIDRAHVAGVSLGAGVGMWLAVNHPDRVASLSLHSAWAKTDPFLALLVKGWQVMARALGSVPEMVIQGIFPWCFTPGMYADRPEAVAGLEAFVRGRPTQPVDALIHQSEAVLAHDVSAHLGRIVAPTQITYGRWDLVTSTRFEPALTGVSNRLSWSFSSTSPTQVCTKTPTRSTAPRSSSSPARSSSAPGPDGRFRTLCPQRHAVRFEEDALREAWPRRDGGGPAPSGTPPQTMRWSTTNNGTTVGRRGRWGHRPMSSTPASEGEAGNHAQAPSDVRIVWAAIGPTEIQPWSRLSAT
jgi:hypothetical protein